MQRFPCFLAVGAFAEVSYQYVELPLRRTGWPFRPVPRAAWVAPAHAVLLLGTVVALVAIVSPRVFRRAPELDGLADLVEPEVFEPADPALEGPDTTGTVVTPRRDPGGAPVLAAALSENPLSSVNMARQPPGSRSLRPADWEARFRKPERVLAFGDSVMLGAGRRLREPGVRVVVDAVPGRQASRALKRLLHLRRNGGLAPVVIVHLGNNGTLRDKQFDRMMYLLSPVKTVIVVTAKVPRRWQVLNNAVMAAGVQRYPNAVLVDWARYSQDRTAWFAGDGYHLAREGSHAYAELLRSYYYYPSAAEWQASAVPATGSARGSVAVKSGSSSVQ